MKRLRAEFVSEPIVVDSSSIQTGLLAEGAPGCPRRFTWRDQVHNVVQILDTDKQLRAYDSREKYVKSHSFRVRTDTGFEMVIRCDRQVRGNPWRVFTVAKLVVLPE
ncbi:MAG: hypothetical protein GX316_09690 [Firmicutes bacterium]|nr:hypothetical protein [Bacillota bacterium]